MDVKIGDIYWLTVEYPSTREIETRPVVVCDFNNEYPLISSFATITTSKIRKFDGKYDKWKVPLFKWAESGLREPSYVKANCIATVDKSVFKKESYIGKMNRTDLKHVKRKVQEFQLSGEEAW